MTEPQATLPPSYLVLNFDPAQHLSALTVMGSTEVLERWTRVAGQNSSASLLVLPTNGRWRGAALLSARKNTGYLKIVDVLGYDEQTRTEVAQSVLEYAGQQSLACVKWEVWDLTSRPEAAGFQRLPAPLRAPELTGPHGGYVHWLTATHQANPTHYQQSENFTCAAVAALIAQGQSATVDDVQTLREAELALWREATNFMACEPVGLGLAVSRRWPDTDVEVFLDTDKPVIVDYYPEAERGWRSILQAQSRREANAHQLPVSSQRLSINQLRAELAGGAKALLLISLELMLGYAVPHWVLCHGVTLDTNKPMLILEDSWIESSGGESWVDATQLPVDAESLESMSSMEQDGYRAAVLLR